MSTFKIPYGAKVRLVYRDGTVQEGIYEGYDGPEMILKDEKGVEIRTSRPWTAESAWSTGNGWTML